MPKQSLLVLFAGLSFLFLTPSARPATWQSIGPDGGDVAVLAFAPSDSRVAYAGALGGVFRSGDGGASWTSMSSGLFTLYVRSLAVDPRDPAVVYAGTDRGLYVTTSGGASWRQLSGSSSFLVAVESVHIDPAHPRILYAVTDAGVFRTADGGSHWTERDAGLPGVVSALDLDPDQPGILYAAVVNSSSGAIPLVYKTTNGGGSWTVLAGLKSSGVAALTRYSSADTEYASTPEGLFASRDGGATWTLLYGGVFNRLVVAPSGTLYGITGPERVVSSVDGGKTWSDPAPSSLVSPGGATALALDSSGDRLLAGTLGKGIFSLDASTGWKEVNRGFRATRISGVAVASTNPPLLFATTRGGGVFASSNGGDFSARNTGIPQHSWGVFATALATNPRIPASLAVGIDVGRVAQTSDAGLQWAAETPVCLSIDKIALASPSTLFVASTGAFYGTTCPGSASCTAKVSRDGGSSFACLDGPEDVSAFMVDPLRPAIVYAAAGGDIWKSTDRGVHFARVASNPGMIITSLASSPAAHQTLYAGGDKGVLKSTDGGVSWSPTKADGLILALAVDPSNPSTLYAAGFFVFESLDGGANWSVLGDGFPTYSYATALALDPVHHVLYAGTESRGVWALALP